jgi:DNA-directed RNA polymerase specialized sigma subunit
MKHYNIENYVRYKKDLAASMPEDKPWTEYTRDELIIRFMPYAEEIARSFSTSDRASGVMSINDLIQEANKNLVLAIDKLDWAEMNMQDNIERQIKGFVSKRIRGGVRRAIDINRGDIRIPEHKLTEIRKNEGKDRLMVEMFFNSIFLSIDESIDEDGHTTFEFPDKNDGYNNVLLNKYILSLMRAYLDDREYDVLRMSFGLDCDKLPAKKIAKLLDIQGVADFVRVSQIKREALDKLIDNVPPDQVLDFLNE